MAGICAGCRCFWFIRSEQVRLAFLQRSRGFLPPLSEGNSGGKAPAAQTGQSWGGMKTDPDHVWAALRFGFPSLPLFIIKDLRAVVFIRHLPLTKAKGKSLDSICFL